MMAEFHLAASVSGYCYCACRLMITLSWLTGIPQEPLFMMSVTPMPLTLGRITVSAEKKAYSYYFIEF